MLRAMTNLDRVRVGPVARPHPGRRRLAMPSQALMRQVIEQASEVRMIWQADEFRSEQFNLGPGRRHVEIERNIAAAFDIRRSEERRVGKECVIRVDLGGRRIIKKKNKSDYGTE